MKDGERSPNTARNRILVASTVLATAALVAFALRPTWRADPVAALPAATWLLAVALAAGRRDRDERAGVLAGAVALAPFVAVVSTEAVREAAAGFGPWSKWASVSWSLVPAAVLAGAARLALGLTSEPQRWRIAVVGAVVLAVAAAGVLARSGAFDVAWLAAAGALVVMAATPLAALRSRDRRARAKWLAAILVVALPLDLLAGPLLADHATEVTLEARFTDVAGEYTVFLPWFEPRGSHVDVVALLAERVEGEGAVRVDVLETGPSLRVRGEGPVTLRARARFDGGGDATAAARTLAFADVPVRVTDGASGGVRVSVTYVVHDPPSPCTEEARFDARPAPGADARWPAGEPILARATTVCP
ncbi:MAG TPA: hypothetical protein VI997_04995 [Candidatus Thermoplasmatota archaeon]|nr:hypothetical protein [Candidatus Thermoplasmatota archaeon]